MVPGSSTMWLIKWTGGVVFNEIVSHYNTFGLRLLNAPKQTNKKMKSTQKAQTSAKQQNLPNIVTSNYS